MVLPLDASRTAQQRRVYMKGLMYLVGGFFGGLLLLIMLQVAAKHLF